MLLKIKILDINYIYRASKKKKYKTRAVSELVPKHAPKQLFYVFTTIFDFCWPNSFRFQADFKAIWQLPLQKIAKCGRIHFVVYAPEHAWESLSEVTTDGDLEARVTLNVGFFM